MSTFLVLYHQAPLFLSAWSKDYWRKTFSETVLWFNSEATYRVWVQDWKRNYKYITNEIREARILLQGPPNLPFWDQKVQSRIQCNKARLRAYAHLMIIIRAMGKEKFKAMMEKEKEVKADDPFNLNRTW